MVADEGSERKRGMVKKSLHIVKATLIYFVLMFSTIFAWFVIGRTFVTIFADVGGSVAISEVHDVAQNEIYALNLVFLALLIVFTIWFAYVAHSREIEQTYVSRKM
jgi:hypothetical protein